MAILADQPELIALASLASVPASRMADAFNDGEHFFEHLSLEELERIRSATERLADVSRQMVEAMREYAEIARVILDAEPSQDAD